jgi:hypothetical protein
MSGSTVNFSLRCESANKVDPFALHDWQPKQYHPTEDKEGCMSETRSTKQLFQEWRQGDAEAGQAMAQRFADWYYAIATSRLGETSGKEPCEKACASFGAGVANITDPRELVGWAHALITAELKPLGERVNNLDEPNAYTRNRNPKALLVKAREALPKELELLEACYGHTKTEEEVDALAKPMGGNPLGILRARYAVKRHLRDEVKIPFEVAPDEPVLDRAPLPLYESGTMATPDELVNFEHWMLSDIDLCKDIAEFAHFAIALRSGLPTGSEAKKAAAKADTPASGAAMGVAAVTGLAIVGIVVVTIILLILGVVFLM